MPQLEFFFDVSSPWTYLAFENLQPMAAELDVAIDWRPILVGGVFNAVNPNFGEYYYYSRYKSHYAKPKVT